MPKTGDWNSQIHTYAANNNVRKTEAKSIALAHADVDENDITFLTIKFDIDKGIAEYEVEWNVGSMEYEYTINAVTGSIIKFDVEID